MTDVFDRAQAVELSEWERRQHRDAPPAEAWDALSARHCKGCGCQIPEARRQAVPGVQLCVQCQEDAEFINRNFWDKL